RRGRAFYRSASTIPPRGPFGQMLRGMAVSLRSYSRPVRSPRASYLLSVDPDIAWWDFHESPRAVAAGERAMAELLQALPSLSSSAGGPRARPVPGRHA